MAGIELWMLPQQCSVETYQGDSAYDDVYGRPRPTRCAVNDEAKIVRGSNGDEVLSQTTILTTVADGRRFTLDSRVTVNGRRSYVVARSERTSGGLGLGDHTEVNLK